MRHELVCAHPHQIHEASSKEVTPLYASKILRRLCMAPVFHQCLLLVSTSPFMQLGNTGSSAEAFLEQVFGIVLNAMKPEQVQHATNIETYYMSPVLIHQGSVSWG